LQCQIKSAESFSDFAELPPQDAGDNQFSAWIQPGANFRRFIYQQIAGQVGANNVVTAGIFVVAVLEGG
jgi:hypothetical protein